MQIFVNTLAGRTVTLDMKASDTVDHMKWAIWITMGKDGPRPIDQQLIFEGKQLDDDEKTLSDYNIQKGSTLHMLVSRPNDITLGWVYGRWGSSVRVSRRDTIYDVKVKIIDMHVLISDIITPDQVDLIFEGKHLGDDTIVHKAFICDGDRVELVPR